MRYTYTTLILFLIWACGTIGHSDCFAQSSICGFSGMSTAPDYNFPNGGTIGGTELPISVSRSTLQPFWMEFPVRLVVINDQHGAANDTGVRAAMQRLNKAFVGANISFDIHSVIRVSDPRFMEMSHAKEAELHRYYYKKAVINVYCMPMISIAEGEDEGCLGYTYSPFADLAKHQQDMIVLTHEGLIDKSTLAHEMGHFFGLLHTHADYFGKESVARIDCKSTGDLLCDTPADPNLLYKVNSADGGSCHFTNPDNEVGPDGRAYEPDVFNIMSYSDGGCRHRFTHGQYMAMERTAFFYRFYLVTKRKALKKGQDRETAVPFFRDLGSAKVQLKPLAVLLVYKDSIQWCDRFLYELRNDRRLQGYFVEDAPYSLVVYNAEMDRITLPDFLDEDVYGMPLAVNNQYNYLRKQLLPDITRYPAVLIIAFNDYNKGEATVLYHCRSYLKPRLIDRVLAELSEPFMLKNAPNHIR